MSLLHKKYYTILQYVFKFDRWHIAAIDDRKYDVWIIKKINSIMSGEPDGKIIEVGCGLGDILSKIRVPNSRKLGYDVEKRIIRALKFAHPGLKGKVGSLNNIKNQKICFLIAVNWLHIMNDDWFQRNVSRVIKNNQINRIIVDTVPVPPYENAHNFIDFFSSHGYVLETKSRGFRCLGGFRHVLIFKKGSKYLE